MNRIEVRSSDIRSIGYDPGSMILEIEFHSGGIYQYSKVPRTVFDSLMTAESHGQFFHKNIKHVYQCSRLR